MLCYTLYLFIILCVQNVKCFVGFIAGIECLGRVVGTPARPRGSIFDS